MPSIDDRGARNSVCVCVCVCVCVPASVCQGVFSRDSDRLRPSVERSRPRYTLKIHTHTHTHTESSGVFRVSVWFGAYHYTLQGKPGLTKADWHCQELWEQSDLIYIRAPSCFCCCCCCVKCFFCGEIPSTAGLEVRGRSSEHEAGRGCESDSGKITQLRPKPTEPSGALC